MDVARLLKDFQETLVAGGYRQPAEAQASYVRVLLPSAPEPVFLGRGLTGALRV